MPHRGRVNREPRAESREREIVSPVTRSDLSGHDSVTVLLRFDEKTEEARTLGTQSQTATSCIARGRNYVVSISAKCCVPGQFSSAFLYAIPRLDAKESA